MCMSNSDLAFCVHIYVHFCNIIYAACVCGIRNGSRNVLQRSNSNSIDRDQSIENHNVYIMLDPFSTMNQLLSIYIIDQHQ